ncbi:MAG: sigma-70 family RNA polymerase sigma factor [Sedimentisphaerales bacterium]|nr:sigma-70 family RNA polymerase sigma factor [Sedimentisphaerales bacterium]
MSDKKAIYYELLILRCKRGQKEALEELVSNWEKRLFYYIHRLIEDEQEAWSILQEVWVKVLQNIKRIREPRKLPVWLYSVTRKTVISHLRKKYSEKELLKREKASSNKENWESQYTFDNVEQVHYGLGRISLPYRDILTLFFLKDLSLEEIAETLHIPKGTVKSRLYYAKQALKEVLEKEAK